MHKSKECHHSYDCREEMNMEILKLQPALKDYLWGGVRLVEEYNKQSQLTQVAESWELSNHKDGNSIITNGTYKGYHFGTYLEQVGKTVWGEKAQKYTDFPILIKLIDAKQTLSIQVHPDDAYAKIHEGEFGKNEFWYIVDTKPNAFIYFGVEAEISKEQFKAAIENDTICSYLKKIHVNKGDSFFIPAGTIHAIGEGVLIAEVQQSSNSTYRIYDYGRKQSDGTLRELHIEKAIDVAQLKPSAHMGNQEKITENDAYQIMCLTKNDYFRCIKYEIQENVLLESNKSSFHAITVIDGCGELISNTQCFEVNKGDSFFIPADYGTYSISGCLSIILTSL